MNKINIKVSGNDIIIKTKMTESNCTSLINKASEKILLKCIAKCSGLTNNCICECLDDSLNLSGTDLLGMIFWIVSAFIFLGMIILCIKYDDGECKNNCFRRRRIYPPRDIEIQMENNAIYQYTRRNHVPEPTENVYQDYNKLILEKQDNMRPDV